MTPFHKFILVALGTLVMQGFLMAFAALYTIRSLDAAGVSIFS